MAETFKNFKLALGTSSATAYTCPASTTAIVLLLQVSNIDGTNVPTLRLHGQTTLTQMPRPLW